MQSPQNIRIILYEDNRNLREGMSFLLQATPGLEMVGAFPDTSNLEAQAPGLKPDVILMDIDLPGRSGIEALPVARRICPEAEVVMLTVFEEEDKILQSIRNGASGYLLKRTSPAEIIAAIQEVHAGGSPMTHSIARRVLHFFQEQLPAIQPKIDYGLSPRELDVLKSLVKGYSYKLIASEHFISMDTVRTHIRHIYEKLQVNSKTEAVLKALKDRII